MVITRINVGIPVLCLAGGMAIRNIQDTWELWIFETLEGPDYPEVLGLMSVSIGSCTRNFSRYWAKWWDRVHLEHRDWYIHGGIGSVLSC